GQLALGVPQTMTPTGPPEAVLPYPSARITARPATFSGSAKSTVGHPQSHNATTTRDATAPIVELGMGCNAPLSSIARTTALSCSEMGLGVTARMIPSG